MREKAEQLREIANDIETFKARQMLIHINKIKQHGIRLSPYFHVHEFTSKDGAITVIIHKDLLDKMNTLRQKVGLPIHITSGYRTPEHNLNVGGSPTSRHLDGMAADIWVNGMTPGQLALVAKEVGFTGIGVYSKKGFTHVDVREEPVEWRDDS